MIGFRNPNVADGNGQPATSRYGQAFVRARTSLVRAFAPVIPSRVRDGARGYRNRFGVVATATPVVPPLIPSGDIDRYTGRLPLSLQPKLNKPLPWE